MSILMLFSLSGCSSDRTENVVYNAGENLFFAQNDDYYFVSNDTGITAVSKGTGASHELITDAFKISEDMDCRVMVCGDYLYYHDYNPFDNSIKRISLLNMTSKNLLSSEADKGGFLGISLNGDKDGLSEQILNLFFTDGSDLYVISLGSDGIYKLSGEHFECIIPERLYENTKVCFDGNRIYYINRRLELKSYDVKSGDTEIISGDFTKAVYYDGTRLLYSNMDGIFALNPNDNTVEILSEERADEITSDGNIVVFSQDKALYMLGEEKKVILDYEPTCFAIIPQTQKLFVRDTYNDADYKMIDFPV